MLTAIAKIESQRIQDHVLVSQSSRSNRAEVGNQNKQAEAMGTKHYAAAYPLCVSGLPMIN
jgi:hypothetical protein